MTEKAHFPKDSRFYLGTTNNSLLGEPSVVLGVYLIIIIIDSRLNISVQFHDTL